MGGGVRGGEGFGTLRLLLVLCRGQGHRGAVRGLGAVLGVEVRCRHLARVSQSPMANRALTLPLNDVLELAVPETHERTETCSSHSPGLKFIFVILFVM